jgi:hypothetical protein
MMNRMNTRRRTRAARGSRILAVICLLSWAVAAPSGAAAQELEIEHDARLEGYGNDQKVVLEEPSTAMTWMGFSFCALVALLGLFKDAKRSHLD